MPKVAGNNKSDFVYKFKPGATKVRLELVILPIAGTKLYS